MNLELSLILRLLLAAALGSAIGLERELRAKGAGLRTHFLVALGSALFMIVSQYGFLSALQTWPETGLAIEPRIDISRMAAQIVCGIGFIGAGTIVLHRRSIVGLTTAASIWVTAAIGCAAAGGLYLTSFLTTILALAGLEIFVFVDRDIGSTKFDIRVVFDATSRQAAMQALESLEKAGAVMTAYSVTQAKTGSGERMNVQFSVRSNLSNPMNVLAILQKVEGIFPVSIE